MANEINDTPKTLNFGLTVRDAIEQVKNWQGHDLETTRDMLEQRMIALVREGQDDAFILRDLMAYQKAIGMMQFFNEERVKGELAHCRELLGEFEDALDEQNTKAGLDKFHEPVKFRFVTAAELGRRELPEREVYLAENRKPIFYRASLNQIVAWRGLGKTMWSLALANALATGGKILDFQAARPFRVAYVDGELPQTQLQDRLFDVAPGLPENLFLLSPDVLGLERPLNLLNGSDGRQLNRLIRQHQIEVLFLDSQSQLLEGDKLEHDFQEARRRFLLSLRLKGLCVVELHHAGKGGLQRGLSENDDNLDLQMFLRAEEEWEHGDGLRFILSYEKSRHKSGADQGYVVSLDDDGNWRKGLPVQLEKAAAMFKAGRTVRQISKELGVSVGKVSGLRQQAVKRGLLEPDKLNEKHAALKAQAKDMNNGGTG